MSKLDDSIALYVHIHEGKASIMVRGDAMPSAQYGMLLADVVAQLVNAGYDRAEVLRGFREEIANPTDTVKEMLTA